uniref:toxin-antitoxin system HicB family antitoxin n=1 Tax=Selenomonas noxia TaxID=135083 RepID=UPI0028EEFD6B
DGISIPEPAHEEDYSGRFNLRLPKSLHKDLALTAKMEGVSLNQLAMCLIAGGLKASGVKQ